MKHLKGLSVLVLGLGDSGLAMARWCARFGASVQVWDSRENPPHAERLAAELPAVVRVTGALSDTSLSGVQLVLKSPGLVPTDANIAPTLLQARQTAVPVQGELDLFAAALADLRVDRGYAPKVVAITGTNGKTTTTSMTAQLIERAGLRVAMAGNIGPTMLDTLLAAYELEPVVEGVEVAAEVTDETGAATTAEADEQSSSNELPMAPELKAVAPAADAAPDAEATPAAQAAHWNTNASTTVPASVEPAAELALGDAIPAVEALAEQPAAEPAADAASPQDAVPAAQEPAQDIAAQDTPAQDALAEDLPVESAPAEAESPVAEAAEVEAEPAPAAPAEPALDPESASDVGGGGPPPHLIPPPPPGPVFEHLPEVWVLELSSFQLDGVTGFEPSAATVLNITQDHLDWHGTLDAYAEAKARIFGKTAVMVINRDDAAVGAMVPAAVPGKGRFAKPVERSVVRFGLDAPKRPGDYGLMVQSGMAWLVRALEADETIKRKRGAVDEEELVIQRLMPADALRVRGRHNASNALAALALATAVGCPLAPMLHGLREYAGEPHRVELITSVNGVEAYDDSKGTNVGATVAALTGLGADKAPSQLVVILGGDGKGQDFSPLFGPVQRFARAVATIGRDAEAIEQALSGTGITVQRHDTLQAATRWAFERAHAGDAVLLSPACASLDMFRNYGHRAEVFVAEVNAISADHGGIEA
ncbi:MAG: hypothetical protein RLZZ618_891 [Pseudomonadota bacterium]